MYLRAAATYYDPVGDAAETAMGVSDFSVEGKPAINAKPKFPDQDPGTSGTQNRVAELEVDEETAVGTSIGDPVVATDADNDPLIYGWLPRMTWEQAMRKGSALTTRRARSRLR